MPGQCHYYINEMNILKRVQFDQFSELVSAVSERQLKDLNERVDV